MSWNFNHTGTRSAVSLKIAGENYVPESVKRAITDVILAPTASPQKGVQVESWGHVDSASAGLKIEIKQVNLVLDDPTTAFAQAGESPKT